MSGYADSTLLTMLQVAAYTAPGMFEHGTALTVQEEMPAFAFYPDMPGDVALGHQWQIFYKSFYGENKKTHLPRSFFL